MSSQKEKAAIMTAGLHLFDTAIGRCGIAWSDHGVVGVQLPEATEASTRARLRRRFPSAADAQPPASIQTAIEGIVALLAGEEAGELRDVELDLRSVPEFNAQVYRVARTIPPGQTTTYGEIALQLADRGAARAVGQALGANPIPIIIPCHRVLAAGDRAGGFSAPGGVTTKLKLLEIERRSVPFALT
jgi:methylated-DNA-[protein]-cysteine S-methyltransferase